VTELNRNTREAWEKEFSENGFWEKNEGRRQTRLFAEYFHKHVNVPRNGEFSVLDVGCAVGDALAVWHRRYPQAKLFGSDVSQVAIERAKREFGHIAHFEQWTFEEIQGQFDVIYCSNVMEHFENHVDIAELLLKRCEILYIMTPYAELNNGRTLDRAPLDLHVASFFDDTFDVLKERDNVRIETKVVRCPVAWGASLPAEILWHLRYCAGMIASPSPPRRQIIYTITRSR
jgi:SAM-dependent methyltransferase